MRLQPQTLCLQRQRPTPPANGSWNAGSRSGSNSSATRGWSALSAHVRRQLFRISSPATTGAAVRLGPCRRRSSHYLGGGPPPDPRTGAGRRGCCRRAGPQTRRLGRGGRDLCYRSYTVCERKNRAAEALAYNGLVQIWPEISRLATAEAPPEQSPLFDGDGTAAGGRTLRP